MLDNNDELKIIRVDIEEEMGSSYVDYAMSVIVGRALPDVRDGLKPVHRRILYTMHEDNFTPDKPHRKCATTVGDVLGRYHPHGDAAVYDSLVRMAQSFSLRYPLVDGHGNFGSVDGDSAAAYRYTEARMSKLAVEMLTDIEKETVDFTPNYDERLKEPLVLPSKFPNLLVNGSSGIAVGMATNIPPHNLREVINGIIALIDNPEITIEELMSHIKAPDFPTGAKIMGISGVRAAYKTGRGRLTVRARSSVETTNEDRKIIVVTEIPYMVNKARLVEKIAELVKDKKIEGISYIRDESDRDGMRIVIELKKNAFPDVVLNQLYKYTQLQDTFSIIMLALVDNEPKVLDIKKILNHYLNFQKQIIIRRTTFEKKKAEERAHILEGLKIALDHIDEIISIIRNSYNNAKQNLIERFAFSDLQAQAILDLRLVRLQGLEQEKIDKEYNTLLDRIKYLSDLLTGEHLVLGVIKDELLNISNKFGDERKTMIEAAMEDIDIEDLIVEEDNVITLTHYGYIKRTPVNIYRTQKRGGRGVAGLQTKEEDFVEKIFVASTHCNLLFFSNKGKVRCLKAYQLPEAGRQAKGGAIVNLLELESEEKITAIIPLRKCHDGEYLLMATRSGVIKKTPLCEYENVRKSGKIGIVLDSDDELINVKLTDGSNDVLLGTTEGLLIRFNENDVRSVGRASRGVRGIRLGKTDKVVGMDIVANGKLLIVSENGFGKKTELDEFKIQNRGGKGVLMYRISQATGLIAGIILADDDKDVIAITNEGVMIRTAVRNISTFGRATKGVRIIKLAEGIKVVGLATLEQEPQETLELETMSTE